MIVRIADIPARGLGPGSGGGQNAGQTINQNISINCHILACVGQIAVNLSHLEEKEGNLARAIQLLELSMKASPNPAALQKQIDELKQKLATPPPLAAPKAP